MWSDLEMMGWNWGWGMPGAAHMVLWWILIFLGVAVLAKWLFGSSTHDRRVASGDALEILRERYARGEIGKDEFAQKKADLA